MMFHRIDDELYLKRLTSLEFNYNAEEYDKSTDRQGWFIDHYKEIVGKECVGPPLENGVFAKIKDAVRLYHFPNPRLIHAVFDSKADLNGRNMLQVARVAGLEFRFGVRVTEVIDEKILNSDNEMEESWGYSYRTLKGHFEIGQITFKITKNYKSGEIFFAINAYSKPSYIPNIFYRWGFRLFGRMLQRYFVSDSFRRIKELAQS